MSSLEKFGFTPTEAKVYEVLLRLGASTGYAVSKAAGLARANTYQALDGLVRRRAARRSATIPARYAALTPDSVVAELERGLLHDLEGLHTALRSLPTGAVPAAATIATLDDWNAVEQSAAALVGRAREEVLAVAGPWAPATFAALGAAIQRGIAVRALSLGDQAPPGIALRSVAPLDLQAYWSGLPLAIVGDRSHALCATLQPDGTGSGLLTSHMALVPFLRHLLRRELAAAT